MVDNGFDGLVGPSAREKLTDIVVRELVGPDDGPEEAIETSPDGRYLVGYIVPTTLDPDDREPPTVEVNLADPAALDDSASVGDDLEAREGSGR